MSTITAYKTFVDGQTLPAGDLNSSFSTIINDYNGGITDVNISASAAIAVSKINTGITGSVVGTTDTQTLTNKTLTSPTINTPTFSAGAVTSPALGLTNYGGTAKGSNAAITATGSLGQTVLSLSSLPAGNYLLYGVCSYYIDNGVDVTGWIFWEINDGSTALFNVSSGYFSVQTGYTRPNLSSFCLYKVLSGTTTLNLATYALDGLTNAAYGSATVFGAVRIG